MTVGRVLLVCWFLGAIALSFVRPDWWAGLFLGVVSVFLFFDLGGSFATWRYRRERQQKLGKENLL